MEEGKEKTNQKFVKTPRPKIVWSGANIKYKPIKADRIKAQKSFKLKEISQLKELLEKAFVEELFDFYNSHQKGYYDEEMLKTIVYAGFQNIIDEYIDNKIKQALIEYRILTTN